MINKFLKKTAFLTAFLFFIWTGYWTASAYAIEHGISLAIEDKKVSETEMQFEIASVVGYPQDFSVGFSDIVIGNTNNFKWATEGVNLDISKPHSISGPFGSFEVDANVANLAILFQPNFQLSLGNLDGLFEDIILSFSGLPDTRIDTVSARIETSQSDKTSYNVNAEIKGFDLSDILVDLESNYQYISNISFIAEVGLTHPIDRYVLYEAAPKVKVLTLQEALINYGSTSITINGELLKVQGWNKLFNLAKNVGFINPDLEDFFYKVLSDIAKQDGSENTLHLPLNVKNNTVSYGVLTLGVLP